jgi:hypothetical protein
VEACGDPRLLAFPLWPRQREILAAIEAGPRLHVLACGRRAGKTSMGALVAVWDACLRPELARRVRARERRYAVCVAVNVAQARLFVAAARSIVEASPLLAGLVADAGDDAIEFSTGCTIAAFPCTSRGARGWPISTLLLDEFAHHVDGEGNSAAESVWRALTPSCAQFGREARIIVASTPWGAEGAFAELWHRAAAGEIPDAVAHHATSAEANPTLDPDFLRGEFERDPHTFEGEYEARFVASGGAYLDVRRLAEAVVDRDELGPRDGTGWVLGLDLGFASDPTGVVLVARDPATPERLRVGLVRKWQPQKARSFEERRAIEDSLLADVAEIAHHFNAPVVADQHLAPQVRDFLSRRGVHAETLSLSAETKSLAFSELRSRIYSGSIELPDHAELLAELRALRAQFRAGRASVVTPRTARGHSDLSVALALGVWKHDRHGVRPGSPDGAHFGAAGVSLADEIGRVEVRYDQRL